MEYDMDRDYITVVLLVVLVILLLLIDAAVSWDMAQKSIISDCDHVSFFYNKDKSYECLPYKHGDLEKRYAQHE
jgi:hypothetical protein